MAIEEGAVNNLYEQIYDMGTGLIIAKVQLSKVKEQDINARIMKKEMQDQLTANIKNRGQLESLPLLVLKDGVLEIISGHHRIKSARAAGLKEIVAIIDVSGLSRSKIASKQLAHNAISGFDDKSTLQEICKMLDDVDDMVESYIGKDFLTEPLEQFDKMISPRIEFDFQNIIFTFLPHQVKDMDALIKALEASEPDIVCVAPIQYCSDFVKTLEKYQKFTDIRNIGSTIHSMIQVVNQKMDDYGYNEEKEWTYLSKLFGGNAIPAETAEIINKAIKKAEKNGVCSSQEKWKAIIEWAEAYLNKG